MGTAFDVNYSGVIFNIQRYSIHDGPGIRTIVFIKGCPLSCIWCSNPESQNLERELVFKDDFCIGCGRCIRICRLADKNEPASDTNSCMLCGNCVEVCPSNAREIIGSEVSIEEIINEVEKDRKYYEQSGGGVTISGGEPLVQADFVLRLIENLNKLHINSVIETTGCGNPDKLMQIAEECFLIYFDLKHMNSETHKLYTGVGNELILSNAERLCASFPEKVVFRMPLIGGVNTDLRNITETAGFIKKNGIKSVHLLPYHEYGSGKYVKLGKEYKCEAYTPDDDEVGRMREIFGSYGISSEVGG